MAERQWNLRMTATYEGSQNKPTLQKVEQQADDGSWKPLALGIDSPGFLVFVYSLLTCQHLYLYANAAENGLRLASSEGTLHLEATQDWKLSDLHVAFTARVASGTPTPAVTLDIQGRMNQCPVSRNVHVNGRHQTELTFTA